MSCYKTADDQLYHLHPELVDAHTDGARALLCQHCHAEAKKSDAEKPKAPKMSIAAGIDFGLLSRLPELEPLSDVELMLLSEVRLYHVVAKVCMAGAKSLLYSLVPESRVHCR